MSSSGRLRNGKKHGYWVTYFADGSRRSEGEYIDGKKTGKWYQYHKNGELASEANFIRGFYTGYYCSYHDNGQKFREGSYNDYCARSSDGTKDGKWIQYAADGNIEHEIVYRRGAKRSEKKS